MWTQNIWTTFNLYILVNKWQHPVLVNPEVNLNLTNNQFISETVKAEVRTTDPSQEKKVLKHQII